MFNSDSGNWARLGRDFLRGIHASISSQYMDSEKDMPTECVGFFPSMFLIYSKQFRNAISKTTEMYFTFFLVKRNEDYLYARYSQRPYRKMSYLRRLFGYLNTFKCPYALQLQIWVCVCVCVCVCVYTYVYTGASLFLRMLLSGFSSLFLVKPWFRGCTSLSYGFPDIWL